MSPAAEFTGAPRFIGSDHSELAKDMAWSLGAAGLGSVAHATSSAMVTGVANSAMDAPLIDLLLVLARRAGRDPDVRAAETAPPLWQRNALESKQVCVLALRIDAEPHVLGASGEASFDHETGHVFSDGRRRMRSEEHTSELQSRLHLVCRLLLEKKKKDILRTYYHL